MTDFYDRDGTKADRALELREKGLTPAQIGERLGSPARSVSAMIRAAKQRRVQAEVNRILERTAETAEKISE